MAGKSVKKLLNNVSPDKAFWVHNGPVLKSVKELLVALRDMSEDTFRHHVNKEKNDFATWVSDVYGEAKVATELRASSSRKAVQSILGKALR